MKSPRILHLSFYHNTGGAARSTYRLHRALCDAGHASHLLCAHRDLTDPTVTSLLETSPSDTLLREDAAWLLDSAAAIPSGRRARRTVSEAAAWILEREWIPSQATQSPGALYDSGALGWDLAHHPLVRQADILTLHWVNGLLNLEGVARLALLGKPLVWRLADAWPLTGGCHYPESCRKFEAECTGCPLLRPHPVDLAGRVFRDKLNLWPRARFTLVCPSFWIAGLARRSALFGQARIEVIRTGIDTSTFHPLPRSVARRILGLPPSAFVCAFVAANLAERRKGFHLLASGVAAARRDAAFAQACDCGHVRLAVAGAHLPSERPGLPLHHFDDLRDDARLAVLYAAANLLVLPILADNLPNTLLESLACGTPVLAFDEGGAAEVLRECGAGWLIPPGDAEALGSELVRLSRSPQEVVHAGRAARRYAASSLAVERQAEAYARLYAELSAATRPGEIAASV